ncbi:hypothetical protein CR513_16505, partial [Mucuna pruriens]
NTQQFGIRGSPTSKIVNEVVVVDNQRLENKITELTSLVRQLAIGQHHSSPTVPTTTSTQTTTTYATYTTKFLRGVRFANTYWSIGHHSESAIVQGFWIDSFSNHSQST